MKKVTLKDLKENLKTWTEVASRGIPVSVSKYNKPYVMIVPAVPLALRIGSMVGKEGLSPVIKSNTRGKYLEFLDEDRDAS